MSIFPNLKIGLWNGWLFMSVFLIQMLVMIFADKCIREKTHVSNKAKQNRFEHTIPLIANFSWLLVMIYSVFLPLQSSTFWFYIGFSTFITGLIILILATFDFMTTPVDSLINKGMYRFSRHPMYLATFFICLGTGFASRSLLFIVLTVLIILCFHQETLIEERHCLARYGSSYQEYLNNVPRWLGIRN